MAVIGAVVGLVGTLLGTGIQVDAAKKAEAAQKKAIAGQMRAEKAREVAMEIDANRKKREAIRQGIIARSQALATGTAQGAAFGSGLQGAFGQIAGGVATNVSGIEGQRQLGAEIFSANRQVLSARRDEASAQTQAALGQGISSLGGSIGKTIGSLGSLFG